jgi:hypothetical protein
MTTTRTLEAARPGAVSLDIELAQGTIVIRAEPGLQRARLIVGSPDDHSPSVRAVRDARLTADEDTLAARIPSAATNRTAVMTGVVTGAVHGNIIYSSGGRTIVDGTAPITVMAFVPEDSAINLNVISAAVNGHGRFRVANIETISGHVFLEHADQAHIQGVSAPVDVASVGGTSDFTSVSGALAAHITAPGHIHASSISGRIDLTASPEALRRGVFVHTKTVSGRIDVPPGARR